ncbi:hypothetical protein [Amycolatopsis anabasis]|uniref:hypothetical protein n=1 Tax=Amycolatopsis anabasis TaxID=1840409 RepID=UPI00131CF4EC|nr:hypothetical protein [Amycolatopsis anabasis]
MIGNVLVYRDNNQVSATYMSTLSPILEHAIDSALDWPTEEGCRTGLNPVLVKPATSSRRKRPRASR